MKVSQLRDLTRKYAAGSIGRDEYLAQRTRLIDGIVSGEVEIQYRELNNSVRAAATGRNTRWYRSGSLLLLALLLLAVVTYFLVEEPETPPLTASSAVTAVTDPRTESFAQFLQNTDWTEPSLTQLESQWNEMSTFEQENVRRSSIYRRLKNATAQRIREQEALVAAGETEALLRVARLRDFAQRLGFEKAPQ